MLATWRRRALAPTALAIAISSAACSSSGSKSSEPSPTLVTVSPSTFGAGVVCGSFPGAWKTYVATLTDVTDPARPFVLASSNPVPCTMPVSFAWVVPGHEYTAEIDGYDRDDLVPWGGLSSGIRTMVAPGTEEAVAPRWTTRCGVPWVDTDGGLPEAGADAGTSGNLPEPTQAVLMSNVIMRHCDPFPPTPGSGDTAIALDLSTVRGALACGAEAGDIDHLRVIGASEDLSEDGAACDAVLSFGALEAYQTYRWRVEAFEAGTSSARWGAVCEAKPEPGVTLPARCDTLSERGALRVDIAALLAASEHTCSPDDVVSYRAVLTGGGIGGEPRACTSDAHFYALAVAAYDVFVDAFDAAGAEVFQAACIGVVQPGATTTMTCQVAAGQP